MSIKGTSVEVIVVLVSFLPPYTALTAKCVAMTGVLSGAYFSSPLYGADRSKRSQGNGSHEQVIDESEVLIQIRSSVNSLPVDIT